MDDKDGVFDTFQEFLMPFALLSGAAGRFPAATVTSAARRRFPSKRP
jgi:hypothetical protein